MQCAIGSDCENSQDDLSEVVYLMWLRAASHSRGRVSIQASGLVCLYYEREGKILWTRSWIFDVRTESRTKEQYRRTVMARLSDRN